MLLVILTLQQSRGEFQSQFWDSGSNQILNKLWWDTTCSCCSFQLEQCGIKTILATNQCSVADYNIIVFKTFQIKPHYKITLSFNFWRIDQWDNYEFYVYLEYQIVHQSQYSHSTSNSNICGNPGYNDEVYPISITIPHIMPALTVIFTAQRGIWGISDMTLEAKLCPEGCQSCNEYGCFDQYLHFISMNGMLQNSLRTNECWLTNNAIQTTIITYLQSRYLQTQGNHLVNIINLNHHQAISLQIKLLIYNSNPTEIKIAIDDLIVLRNQYTGGWIKYPYGFGYRSIKLISIHQYPHINSQAKITIKIEWTQKEPTWQIFFGIRDFQLFLKSQLFEFTCKDDNLIPFDGCFQQYYDCVDGCSSCIRGLCLDCKQGWDWVENDQNCVPICGDLQITQFEECDDGNNIPYDGCHLCKYSCPLNCEICQFGECLKCKMKYQISLNKKQCQPFCSNGIQINYDIFDKQSNNQLERINICQQRCSIECNLCIDDKCLQCNDGWQLQDNKCHQVCGDGLIAINSIEVCDDGNYNDGDGCYQCQFECIPYCFSCSDQSICLTCIQFFILVNDQCLPKCGDGILITGLEECEDDNDQPYDGCYQCKFSCIQNCDICHLGLCKKCNTGYQFYDHICVILDENLEDIENLFNNTQIQSLEFCGDGILSEKEQCDDLNQLNFDGCSESCQIESSWNCNPSQPSICHPQTKFNLSYLNNTQQIQYVQLSFTNQLIFNNNIENYSTFIYEIQNCTSDQYSFEIIKVYEIQQFNYLDLSYVLEIKFFNSLDSQPILKVSLFGDIIDIHYFQVFKSEQKIALQPPRILSESQIQTAINLKNFNFWILIGLCVCAFIMIILGDFQQFMEILDILQFQSFLKFLNVPFPQNVEIYFESSNFVTIKPLFNKIQLQYIFDNIFTAYHCDGIGKFKYYNINADLLNNIYGLISQIMLIFIIDIFLRYLKRQYYQSHNLLRILNYLSQKKSKIYQKISTLICNLTKTIMQQPLIFNRKFLLYLILANSWDILFKILLFLFSCQEQTIRSLFSYSFSIGYLIFIILTLIQQFRRQNFNLILRVLRNKQHQAILLFKKLIFLMILIGIQDQPITQCILLSVLLFTYLSFINTVEFIYSDAELMNIMCQDVSVMLFTLLSLAFCTEFYRYLTANQYFILGFIQIGLLMIGLTGPLIKCAMRFYKKVQAYIENRKEVQKLNEERQTANPNILTELKY
ncbi:unnamed protein product [Paramecium sonneborni]|uniref:Insulin-like growth factor binding protein, N-terminal n=1 Tax=Paramecium sonneborni TaxID=65129 RepID=A0A8S1PZ18_9CILI|nr:unnamed protein product [Paramecium sonneborni]